MSENDNYKPFVEFSDLKKVKLASGEEVDVRKKSNFKKSKRVTNFARNR